MTLQQRYTYDSLGRLVNVGLPGTQISGTNPQNANVAYNLDPAGNRTSVVASGGSLLPTSPQVSALPKNLPGDFVNAAMMVLLSNGTLVGWGNNTTGALANGTTSNIISPMQAPVFNPKTTTPPSGATIVDWAFTNANLYVVYSNGWVYSAGANDYGQLGQGDTVQRPYLQRIDFFATNGITVTEVWAAGSSSTTNAGGCVYFNTSAGLFGCGANGAGNLGNPTTPTTNLQTPAVCSGIPTYLTVSNVAISCIGGFFSTYVLCTNGNLYVAGYNGQGELGTNTTTNVTGAFVVPYQAPWPGPTFGSVQMVSATGGASGGSALILDSHGYLWGTGYNAYGQIFPATTTNRSQFTNLNLGSGVSCGIGGGSLGSAYTIQPSGQINLWGYNASNNLFLNNTTNPNFGSAPFVPGGIAQVLFPRSDTGTAAQTLVLTIGGQLVYAGYPYGLNGVNNSITPGAYYYLAMPASIYNRTESIVSVMYHGTAAAQRLFILTDQGNLYASGDNTSCVCTGGLTSNNTPTTINWHHIDFSTFLS